VANNDSVGQPSANISFCLLSDVEKLLITFSVNVANGPSDKMYQIELIKATFDANQIFKNVKGNIFFKSILNNFVKALDFDPKFPMKKVSMIVDFCGKYFRKALLFQGNYTITNFIITDEAIPFNVRTEGLATGRFVGKIAGKKSMVHLFSFAGFGRVDRSLLQN